MISMMVHVLMLHSPRISLCDIRDGTCINVTLSEDLTV